MPWVALYFAAVLAAGAAAAQGITPAQMKPMLEATRANWIAFRNWDGRELIYFTQLLTFRCGLKEIRYGFNGEAAARTFPLPPCDPNNPFAIDAAKHTVYLSQPLGSVSAVTIRLGYADGTQSAPVSYVPCNVPGDQTCGRLKP